MVVCLVVVFSFTTWQLIATLRFSAVNRSLFIKDSTEKDILSQALSWNTQENILSQQFRSGHVTNTSLTNYFVKTEYGYYVQLPSTTNIPTPAVLDGSLYVSGGFGSKQYYSFDALTGKLKWAVDINDDGPSAPAIQDGTIVFNTESCTIFACDVATGKQIWSYYLGDPLMSMPTIADGIVFTSYPSSYLSISKRAINDSTIIPTHALIAIELKTGKILWQKWIDSDIMSAPVAKDSLLYITTFSGALYKLHQKSGQILEAKTMRATSAPVFNGNGDLIVSKRSDSKMDSIISESLVYGLATKRKQLFTKNAEYLDQKVQEKASLKSEALKMDAGNGFVNGAPASANYEVAKANIGYSNVSSLQSFQGSRALYRHGRLYNTMGDEVICTDSSGSTKWKYKLRGDLKNEGGFMGTPPAYAGGYIIVATLSGELLILNEKNGEVFKKYEIKDPVRYQPVIDKGWIYVTTTNGKLHAINTGNAKITGWNMWGGNAARTNDTSL
jgi:Ca-activated chloride channel homolog